MNTNFRTWVAAAAISGSLLTVGVGAASAQTATTTAASSTAATASIRRANGGFATHAPAIAKALAMTTDELSAARNSGKTIAQLATEKGVNLQTIIATWVAEEQAEHPDMSAATVLQRVTDSANNVKPTGGGRGTKVKPSATASTTATTVAV
jgi:phage tail protein X